MALAPHRILLCPHVLCFSVEHLTGRLRRPWGLDTGPPAGQTGCALCGPPLPPPWVHLWGHGSHSVNACSQVTASGPRGQRLSPRVRDLAGVQLKMKAPNGPAASGPACLPPPEPAPPPPCSPGRGGGTRCSEGRLPRAPRLSLPPCHPIKGILSGAPHPRAAGARARSELHPSARAHGRPEHKSDACGPLETAGPLGIVRLVAQEPPAGPGRDGRDSEHPGVGVSLSGGVCLVTVHRVVLATPLRPLYLSPRCTHRVLYPE